MVYRVYVEKKQGFDNEARALAAELKNLLGIEALEGVRLLNRYDAENITEALFSASVKTVFSEPQLDDTFGTLSLKEGETAFAVEYLPGQFDQRADSAAQCIQIIAQCDRPIIRTARVYVLSGRLGERELEKIKKYVVNPVESRIASMELPETLALSYALPSGVDTLSGFLQLDADGLKRFVRSYGLAMDEDDIAFCQSYFREEGRDPTITEIRMIDTYWSDHCRHTTFLTTIDGVKFEDHFLQDAYEEYLAARREINRVKPVNLMDIATLAGRYLGKKGLLPNLDESEEINACTVKIKVTVDGEEQDWLLLFKNETHNHPTEIEPFGGAATCIGGAIRDPLSGRSYVYAAMRVTGAGDPLKPVSETLEGKLPQRKIVTTAAAGYSSYGNQIGLATGIVDEIYHEGYVAKRMEIGAVIAAAPAKNVRRERPVPGDAVILLGGRTGRDGCGGATGSSKSHTLASLESCGAEVQKGNAPEERKLQRLFRNPEASAMIKRCNDFGAGGVSVAIGELADGLRIELDRVPKKYEGLDGTELAISESQERMAVVVAKEDAARFIALASAENLESTVVAEVQEAPRLTMYWKGKRIVDLSRAFLNSNGAEKHITAAPAKALPYAKSVSGGFADSLLALSRDLNVCSKRGLSERFDSTIGAGSVLMPFGGKYQRTPVQAMVNKISVEKGHTQDCSFMAWGYNPFITEKSPYHGAYLAVIESVSKVIAAGGTYENLYLTFQEYFEKPQKDPRRWGKPMAALLGAFKAQMNLKIAAIGGKDSMSGTFEHIDVPPTLVSFAVTTGKTSSVVSPEFKKAGHRVILLAPEYDETGLPVTESFLAVSREVSRLIGEGKAAAVYTPTYGGIAEAVMKMAFGNGIGFAFNNRLSLQDIFGYRYGSYLVELAEEDDAGVAVGETVAEEAIVCGEERVSLASLAAGYEGKLEPIFACNLPTHKMAVRRFDYTAGSRAVCGCRTAAPRVLIPVFPGTNCEYDTAKAFADAGAKPEIFVVKNLTKDAVAASVRAFAEQIGKSQIVFIPGGFSGGDEPDGSGKFITAFFRNAAIRDAITELLERRDGLMGGICNGFQALIKLGLVPYGKIVETDANSPTLTYNNIGRHQSKIVHLRVASNKSPWFAETKPGEIYSVPISHGEGKFVAPGEVIAALAENGQIATQYVDLAGNPTYDVQFNPNGSFEAVEGITSPDGRIFGKMGHSERWDKDLYQNVPGNYDMGLFRSAVKYFK